MDKQKQIDEMAKDIYWCKSCDTSFEENCGLLAYELYNAGYRKIPENVVVLTREDWESEAYVRAMENDLCKKCRERIGEEYEKLQEKIRILEVQLDLERSLSTEQTLKIKGKHTANKIMNDISGDVLVVDTKEYGRIEVVPLERLYEICEEFTEVV